MEFEIASENDKALAAPDEHADSNTGWDDEEETLSFCYFVREQVAQNLSTGDSNPGSSDLKDDFDFHFDLGQTSSTTHNIYSAENPFQQGRVLPFSVQRCWSESNAHFSQSKSNSRHESRRLLNEKLKAWRTDLSDMKDQSLQRKGFQSVSAKKIQRVNFVTLSSNFTSIANRASKPVPRVSKTCMKWQQFLTLGFMKTDPVTLEDMWKPNNNGLDNSVLKRSVSCDYPEIVIVEKKEATAMKFQQKSKSVKGNLWVKGTLTSRAMLATLKSFNRCRFSTDSVKNCLVEDRKSSTRVAPVKVDQNTHNGGGRRYEASVSRRHLSRDIRV